jgi:hypothetical protein
MASVTIHPTALAVELSRAEAFWGLHKSITLHAAHIVGAQALGKGWWKSLGWRLPGAAIPGLIIAGTFVQRGDKAYVSWTKGTQPLQINLRNHKYSRIVVGVADAEALAEDINAAIIAC